VVTHYDVLGVGSDALLDEIKRAYYDRARLYHPDAHASSSPAVRAEAERTMQALNSSWTILRDATRRRRYDRFLDREGILVGATTAGGAGAGGHTGSPAGSAAAARPTSVRGRAGGSTRRPGPQRPARAELSADFQYWFGAGYRGALHGLNLRVNGSSLAPLRALGPDRLVALHAEHTTVDDDQLRNLLGMRGLRFLDLTRTPVTDAGLVHLLGCHDLEVLSLWDTAITDDGLALVSRLPNLRQLGLGNTAITDDGLRHLAGLTKLRLVQLSGTDVNGPGLRYLHHLRELETVTLPWKVRRRDRRRLRRARPTAVLS
jgi:hypothetical protein